MEHHRSLYKDLNNGLLSPSRFNKINRNLNNANRAEKRMQNYLNSRQISLSPSPNRAGTIKQKHNNSSIQMNSGIIGDGSSTTCGDFNNLPIENSQKQLISNFKSNYSADVEKLKSEKEVNGAKLTYLQRQNAFDEETFNTKQSVQNKENQPTSGNDKKSIFTNITRKSAAEKVPRRENFLSRYIEWKKEKKVKEEEKKNRINKPFVPAGVHSKPIITPDDNLMPKNHRFKPPAGIKSPVPPKQTLNEQNRKARQSIYTIVQTPPKKNILGGDHLNKKAISGLTSEISRSKLNNPERKINPTYSTAKIGVAEINPGIQLRKTTTTKKFIDKKVVSSVHTETTNTANSSVKPCALVFPQKIPSNATNLKKIPEIHINKQDKPKTVQPIIKAINDNAKLNNVKTGVSNVNTLKTKLNKETEIKATGKVDSKPTKTTLQRGAIGKIKELRTKHESNIKESQKTTHLSRNFKSKKVNQLPHMKKKVAINYLNDQELKTPFEIGNSNPFEAFITSTKLKSPLTKAVKGISTTVSPVKPLDTQERQRSSSGNSAKRMLTYNAKKFNFLRYSLEQKASQHLKQSTFNKNELIDKEKTVEPVNHLSEDDDKFKTPPKIEDKPVSYLSPFVSVSRGKVSLIKEKEKRNSIYLNTEADCVMKDNDTNITQASLSIEARRILAAVSYFRKQLSNETERLHQLCDNWEKYKSENLQQLEQMGGDDMINVTIGQTRLLTSKKFMQFNGLIGRCENGAIEKDVIDDGSEDTKPVTDVDLEGFWSMLGLQIDNVDKRFDNLNRWRDNNWTDPDTIIKINEKKKKMKPKAKAATKAKPSSALQEMLRKIHTERRNNTKPTKKDNLQNGTEFTPTRKRRSHSSTPSSQGRSSSRRVSVLVRDRKSFSRAPTIITMTTPSRKTSLKSPKCTDAINEFRRSLTNMQDAFVERTDLLKIVLMGAERKRLNNVLAKATPSPVSKRNERKSILKTPGTEKGKPKNVNFSEKLQIKRFKFIINDEEEASDEVVEQKSESENIKALNKNTNTNISDVHAERNQDRIQSDNTDGNESPREYKLRNRKIKLRPSSDIIIP